MGDIKAKYSSKVMDHFTNPRNVEEAVSQVPGVLLHNIDSLRKINEANLERRRAEVTQVERIILDELSYMKKAYNRQRADHVIGDLYLHADNVRLAELDRAADVAADDAALAVTVVDLAHDLHDFAVDSRPPYDFDYFSSDHFYFLSSLTFSAMSATSSFALPSSMRISSTRCP